MSETAGAIRDVRKIRLLRSPVRQLVLDALEAAGPLSVADLGKAIDQPPDRLYYHVQLLVRHGLIRAVRQERSNGRPGLIYAAAERGSRLQYKPADPANVAAVTDVARGMGRAAVREFASAFRARPAVSGPRRELWAARRVAWLSPDELEQVNEALVHLFAQFEKHRTDRRGRKAYAVTVVLAPLKRNVRPSSRRSS